MPCESWQPETPTFVDAIGAATRNGEAAHGSDMAMLQSIALKTLGLPIS